MICTVVLNAIEGGAALSPSNGKGSWSNKENLPPRRGGSRRVSLFATIKNPACIPLANPHLNRRKKIGKKREKCLSELRNLSINALYGFHKGEDRVHETFGNSDFVCICDSNR